MFCLSWGCDNYSVLRISSFLKFGPVSLYLNYERNSILKTLCDTKNARLKLGKKHLIKSMFLIILREKINVSHRRGKGGIMLAFDLKIVATGLICNDRLPQ